VDWDFLTMRTRWNNLRLQHKLVLSMALISALLTAGALAVIQVRVHDQIDGQIGRQVQNSLAAFQNFQARSEALAASTAHLVSSVPSLEAALTTSDARTVEDPVADISSTLAPGTLLVVGDRTGRVMARVPAAGGISAERAAALLRTSLAQARSRDWWYGNGRLYQVFLRPVLRGDVTQANLVGWVALGREMDRTLAEQVSKLAGGDVVFSYNGQPVVSSLDAAAEQAFAQARLAARPGLRQGVALGGGTYSVDTETLDGPGSPQVTVLRSFSPEQAFLRRLNRLVLLMGLLALLLGAGLAYIIAGAFTRPLSALVEGARALEAGNYAYPLPRAGGDEAGQLTAAFSRMRDSLDHSQQRLLRSARMEAVGQLAGGVAHDFNNLITVVNGFSDLLLERSAGDSTTQRYAAQIRQAGDRAAALTRQLLVFSRKDAAEVQAVDINAVVAGLHKMVAMLMGEHIELVLRAASGLPRVELDPTHLEQVVMNFAANARDAMPRGGSLTLSTALVEIPAGGDRRYPEAAPGAYVELAARDTGIGMDAATQRRIFEPFYTTKEVGKGTGLGLSTVYGIVQRARGCITVESALGKGTCFRVLFPASRAGEAEAAGEAAAAAVQGGASGTILLVEDEEGVRAMAGEVLREAGYEVLEAANGEEALDLLRRPAARVDLVISDVVMPRMGGAALAQELHRTHPGLPVLLTSGHTERALADYGVQSDDIPFLAKPFAPAAMLARIRELLSPTPAV
jgi:signal transduction histidine kinase/CheY-like chemotaxis protein